MELESAVPASAVPVPAAPASAPEGAPARGPEWRLVAIFYGICFVWVSLVALGMYLAGANMSPTGAQLVFQLSVAFLYMPAPLVSALIAERVGKRRPLIRTTFEGFGRKLRRLLLAYGGLSVAVFVTFLVLVIVCGNVLHVPGVGQLVGSQSELDRNLTALMSQVPNGQAAASAHRTLNLPPLGLMYVVALLGGLSAGLTVNGLFAFGEEYGWRGFLMEELRSLGPVRANLVIGVLWGLFHAPIILMGFDFAPHRFLGIPMMVVLCTPFSFLLWRARQFTGSLLAPAILHGAFNGYAGFFLLLVVSRDPVVSLPVGLLGAAGMALVALAFWKWSEGRLAESAAA